MLNHPVHPVTAVCFLWQSALSTTVIQYVITAWAETWRKGNLTVVTVKKSNKVSWSCMLKSYQKLGDVTCRVYPGSHWKDTTLFIWRRSPTLMPFIGTTGSGQLVRETAGGTKNIKKILVRVKITKPICWSYRNIKYMVKQLLKM